MEEIVRVRFPAACGWILDNWYRNHFGSHKKVLQKLGLSKGMHIFDIGCGSGLITSSISDIVGDTGLVVALDINPKMLKRAKIRLKAADNVLLVLGDASHVPFASYAMFDAVVLYYALHEIPNRQQFLEKLVKMLREHGILVVIEPRIEVGSKLLDQEIHQAGSAGFELANMSRSSFWRTELVFRLKISNHLREFEL